MNDLLTPEAKEFLRELEEKFGSRRRDLMQVRDTRQQELDRTGKLDFLPQTEYIRIADWQVRPAPEGVQDRRVEITGPVDRKMVINALNSGANVYMADFEDSSTPTWANLIDGQRNLIDANNGSISYDDPKTGKHYKLNEKHAVLMVRPRGLHMEEKHFGMSASFFDFGLYLFYNRRAPYFYLPKMESHLEARLWNDVIVHAEDALELPRGTVRVTVLIETIAAAFQMDEILYELRDHILGLNCGRWDYIFNFIKRFAAHKSFVLPDRAEVTMTTHFMRSYSQLLIKTCHRRGAHAMGGMAAQIPIKNDEAANKAALDKVAADKLREVTDGHDGTWVAHPALVPLAKEIFDKHMPAPNQLGKLREDVNVTAADLLTVPKGNITEEGARRNVNIGILYLRAWLSGNGCVPIYNMMEDAATAEISRAQLWQWRKHGVFSDAKIESFISEEAGKLESDKFTQDAVALFREMVLSPVLDEFLTTKAYEKVLSYGD